MDLENPYSESNRCADPSKLVRLSLFTYHCCTYVATNAISVPGRGCDEPGK